MTITLTMSPDHFIAIILNDSATPKLIKQDWLTSIQSENHRQLMSAIVRNPQTSSSSWSQLNQGGNCSPSEPFHPLPSGHLGHSTGSRCGAASFGLGNSLTIRRTVSAKGSHLASSRACDVMGRRFFLACFAISTSGDIEKVYKY